MPATVSNTTTSRAAWKGWPWIIAAGVLGYAVIVVITSAGFNGWLDGADPYMGNWALKLQATAVVLAAGIVAGALAVAIGAHSRIVNALAVIPFVAFDTAYVVFYFQDPAPWWFHVLGGAVLTAAVMAGGCILAYTKRRHGTILGH